MKLNSLVVIFFPVVFCQDIKSQVTNECRTACSVLQNTALIASCIVQCVQIFNFNNPNDQIEFPLPNREPIPLPPSNIDPTQRPVDQPPPSTIIITNTIDIITTSVPINATPTIIDVVSSTPSRSLTPIATDPTVVQPPLISTSSRVLADGGSTVTQTKSTSKLIPTKSSSIVPTTIYSFSHSKASSSTTTVPSPLIFSFLVLISLSKLILSI